MQLLFFWSQQGSALTCCLVSFTTTFPKPCVSLVWTLNKLSQFTLRFGTLFFTLYKWSPVERTPLEQVCAPSKKITAGKKLKQWRRLSLTGRDPPWFHVILMCQTINCPEARCSICYVSYGCQPFSATHYFITWAKVMSKFLLKNHTVGLFCDYATLVKLTDINCGMCDVTGL